MKTEKIAHKEPYAFRSGTKRRCLMICISAALFLAAGFFLCVFAPKKEYSDSERRRLARRPQFCAEMMQSGRFAKEFEAYAADTFPFREQLRRLQAWTAVTVFGHKDHKGLYLADGFLSKQEYPLWEDSLERAVRRFAEVYAKYRTQDSHAWLSVIPDKNCFLAGQSGHLAIDYEALEKIMEQKAEFAEYIKISDLLEKDDYYKTDPHWRQEKITDIAKRLAQRMGTAVWNEYTMHTFRQDFYGAYYGQAALHVSPDTLRYLTADAMDRCTVYDWQNRREIPVYDLQKAAGRDPYEMFLSGPLSLITMENPDAPDQKRLVIFRDSFGSSLAPLLLGGFSQITLVDLRYIRPELLSNYLHLDQCDFLFLYSVLVLNHSETLK